MKQSEAEGKKFKFFYWSYTSAKFLSRSESENKRVVNLMETMKRWITEPIQVLLIKLKWFA